ncbi:MAG TPA: lipid-binding SYLF domain-containing protein [Acidobacteriota bacterium]|nr:lipid-binding SYLF domain-containing protein [Acidobacteriota bacterium]HRV09496.1 lipid-binding SYLF domain-containing protein [Acidobacteriota bacterium]
MNRTGGTASFLVFGLAATVYAGNQEEVQRLEECARVLEEVLDIPEGIPQDLLDKAECVVVIPSMKKFALGFGGSYGKGAMVCRSGKRFDGPWTAPAMMRLEGGSFGLQLGGSATDVILLVVNSRGAESLLKSKVKLGADAKVAAGPKGRSTEAATDVLMTAEILAYSRSKGIFAGISLEGSTLRPDDGANEDVYGRKIEAQQIVLEGAVDPPAGARPLINLLQKRSPKNLSD